MAIFLPLGYNVGRPVIEKDGKCYIYTGPDLRPPNVVAGDEIFNTCNECLNASPTVPSPSPIVPSPSPFNCNGCEPSLCETYTVTLANLGGDLSGFNGVHTLTNDPGTCRWYKTFPVSTEPNIEMRWTGAIWEVKVYNDYSICFVAIGGGSDPCDPTAAYTFTGDCTDLSCAGTCAGSSGVTCAVTDDCVPSPSPSPSPVPSPSPSPSPVPEISPSPSTAPVSQTMYATDAGSPSNLYTVDPTTGVRTLVGSVGHENVRSLAIHPITGVLYGVSVVGFASANLITINTSTGTGTLVGNLDPGCPMASLTIDGSGNAYLTSGGCLGWSYYSVNLATAGVTFITNLVSTSGQGLTWMSSGAAWYEANSSLYAITLATGALGAPLALSPANDVRDMCDYGGQLYGVRITGSNTGALVSINTSTGVMTDIGASVSFMGLAA